MMIAHIILAVLGTVWFLYSFVKQRKTYQLLFVIWIPLTLLTYISKNRIFLTVLGIVQLLLFILVIYFLFRNPNRQNGGYRQMLQALDSYGRDEETDDTSAETAAQETENAVEGSDDISAEAHDSDETESL